MTKLLFISNLIIQHFFQSRLFIAGGVIGLHQPGWLLCELRKDRRLLLLKTVMIGMLVLLVWRRLLLLKLRLFLLHLLMIYLLYFFIFFNYVEVLFVFV